MGVRGGEVKIRQLSRCGVCGIERGLATENYDEELEGGGQIMRALAARYPTTPAQVIAITPLRHPLLEPNPYGNEIHERARFPPEPQNRGRLPE